MELGIVKSRVAKLSEKRKINVQMAWDMFFFEKFLQCISLSKYAKRFVFKGGFYLQSIVGVDARSTMDIDLKLIGNSLEDEELIQMMNEICQSSQNGLSFTIKGIKSIALDSIYGGKSIKIEGKFYNVKKVFGVDIGIGDVVTPYPCQYYYPSSFFDEKYELLAYPIETIIAEKFETLISKGLNNSRSKDIFDMYLLEKIGYDENILNSAFINTFHFRKNIYDKKFLEKTMTEVFEFNRIKNLYDIYCEKHSFAKEVSFTDCKEAISKIFSKLQFLEKINLSEYNVELHLVRHGQDEQGKLGGWSDNHLTNVGIKEVEALSNELAKNYDLFISSDLVRAKETSRILNKQLNMEITYNESFREMNNGDLANLSKEDAQNKYPGLYFSSLRMDEHYPNGESPNEFFNRVQKAFLDLLENNRNKKILLVSHGGVITVILCLINGYVYSNQLKITPKTASLTILK